MIQDEFFVFDGCESLGGIRIWVGILWRRQRHVSYNLNGSVVFFCEVLGDGRAHGESRIAMFEGERLNFLPNGLDSGPSSHFWYMGKEFMGIENVDFFAKFRGDDPRNGGIEVDATNGIAGFEEQKQEQSQVEFQIEQFAFAENEARQLDLGVWGLGEWRRRSDGSPANQGDIVTRGRQGATNAAHALIEL